MWIVLLFFFVLSWVLGMRLYRKSEKIVLLICPFASVLAFCTFHLWLLLGFRGGGALTAAEVLFHLTINVGFYPVLAAYLVYYVDQVETGMAHLYMLGFICLTTFLENGLFSFIVGKETTLWGEGIYLLVLIQSVRVLLIYAYYRLLSRKGALL